jgi:hypothetical protein
MNERALEIAADQGWNDHSLYGLMEQFIADKGLDDEFADFLSDVMIEDNADIGGEG